jgi:hypothetical protein
LAEWAVSASDPEMIAPAAAPTDGASPAIK